MPTLWRFATTASLALATWLVVTYADVRLGDGGLFLNYLFVVVLPVTFAGFLWASWPLFRARSPTVRLTCRTGLAAIATLIWALPALYLVLQFYMLAGGRL